MKYVYEVIKTSNDETSKGYRVGNILIKNRFHGYYKDVEFALWDKKEHDYNFRYGYSMHFLFKLEHDTKKEKQKAVVEIEEKLAKKKKFITRDVFEKNKKKQI